MHKEKVGFLLFIIVLVLMMLNAFFWDEKVRYRNISYNLSYDGIIIEKYISDNHRSRIIVLEDGQKLSIYGNFYNIYDSIRIGDRVIKYDETLVGYVYRGKLLIYEIDYNWR